MVILSCITCGTVSFLCHLSPAHLDTKIKRNETLQKLNTFSKNVGGHFYFKLWDVTTQTIPRPGTNCHNFTFVNSAGVAWQVLPPKASRITVTKGQQLCRFLWQFFVVLCWFIGLSFFSLLTIQHPPEVDDCRGSKPIQIQSGCNLSGKHTAGWTVLGLLSHVVPGCLHVHSN